MSKWIAAALIFIFFVAPVPFILVVPEQPLADIAYSWLMPKDALVLGHKYVEDIRTRNPQPVIAAFEPQYATPQMPSLLSKVADLFPAEKPLNDKLVGARVVERSGITTYELSYEYEFPRSWVLARIALNRSDQGIRIHGYRVYPLTRSFEQAFALTFTGKDRSYYAVAAAFVLLFAFWVASVYACLFAPIAHRKWLWVIFVMLGFMSLSLNWTTGHFSFALLSISVPAVKIGRDFYAPWILQFTLPFGAIVFWINRSTLVKVATPTLGSVDSEESHHAPFE